MPDIDLNRYGAAVAELEARYKLNGAAPRGVALYGSSTFAFWKEAESDLRPLAVCNFGFGGSTAAEALHFYPRLIAPAAPSAMVWYEGDNDLAEGFTPEDVAEISSRVFGRFRADFPDSPLLILGVKECPARQALIPEVRRLNSLMECCAKSAPPAAFADISGITIDSAGRFRRENLTGDAMHFSRSGYAELAEIIKSAIAGFEVSGVIPICV